MLHAPPPVILNGLSAGSSALQPQQLLAMWLGIARGMQHLHACRVVHRGEINSVKVHLLMIYLPTLY